MYHVNSSATSLNRSVSIVRNQEENVRDTRTHQIPTNDRNHLRHQDSIQHMPVTILLHQHYQGSRIRPFHL